MQAAFQLMNAGSKDGEAGRVGRRHFTVLYITNMWQNNFMFHEASSVPNVLPTTGLLHKQPSQAQVNTWFLSCKCDGLGRNAGHAGSILSHGIYTPTNWPGI